MPPTAVPGFGGVLDVIDSLIFAGPVAYGSLALVRTLTLSARRQLAVSRLGCPVSRNAKAERSFCVIAAFCVRSSKSPWDTPD